MEEVTEAVPLAQDATMDSDDLITGLVSSLRFRSEEVVQAVVDALDARGWSTADLNECCPENRRKEVSTSTVCGGAQRSLLAHCRWRPDWRSCRSP